MPTYVCFDEPIIVTCDRCGGGRGDFVNPCDWCGATGGVPIEFSHRERLATLAHSLAIGAALCRAFDLGDDESASKRHLNDSFNDGHLTAEEWKLACSGSWLPGCGRSAP